MQKKKWIAVLLISMLALMALTGCGGGESDDGKADTVIMGTIYTADEKGTLAQAVAVKDGVYTYVGDEKGADAYIGDKTEVIKLEKGMAMPGFFDGHTHGHQGGVGELYEVALFGGESMDDYVKAVQDFSDAHPDIKFLTGVGWNNGYVPKGGPTKELLDKITSDIPILIHSEDHHSIWVNSKAMEIAGVTAETPDVPGGVIERDPATKEPTGTFRENARDLFEGVIPDYTVEQYKKGIMAYQDEANSFGLTAYFEPMINLTGEDNLLAAYNELDKEGALKMKVFGGYKLMPDKDPMKMLDKCAKLKEEAKGGDFEITAVKILVDGVVEGKTAYLLENYASDPGNRSEPLWDQELLNQVCEKANKLGIQAHTHAIGDAAVKMTLDAYEYAQEKNGEADYRNTITHLQLMDPADIQRMADLKVVASVDPYWFCKEPGYFYELEVPYLGEERANQEYPMKSLFDADIVVASASDYPVTIPAMPLDAIQKGVTRCSLDGAQETLQNPDQRVTIDQMLKSFTGNAAYQNFAEKSLGSVEVGKNADIVILSQDLTKIDPFKIIDTKIEKTIFKGKTVYEPKK